MTDPRPAISVVIPCAGGLPLLRTQLDALEGQRDAPPFEVIVVDNGSEGALDEIRHRRLRVPCGLRLVDGAQRRGSSYARNVGARCARSELLMFCDADDVVSASWVRNGRKAFDLSPVWTGAAISVHDDDFRAGAAAIQARIDDVADDDPPPVPDSVEHPTILMGGNFGIRRDLYLALGGFDMSVPYHGDDNDLAVRIRLSGWQIPRFESVRIGYRHHPGMRAVCGRAYFASRAAERSAVVVEGGGTGGARRRFPRGHARAETVAARVPGGPLVPHARNARRGVPVRDSPAHAAA